MGVRVVGGDMMGVPLVLIVAADDGGGARLIMAASVCMWHCR